MMDEVLIKLKSVDDVYKLEQCANENALIVAGPNEFDPELYIVKLTKSSQGNAVELANKLHETNTFSNVEPNFYIKTKLSTSDPLYNLQWALNNTGQKIPSAWIPGTVDADVDAPEAWQYNGPLNSLTNIGTNVKIAILDDGIDLGHEDLCWGQRMLNGYDAFGVNPNGAFIGGLGHGTLVAGAAVATANNGKGVAGVAPGATIMPIRMLSTNGAATTTSLHNAFNYALCSRADVLICSWGNVPQSSEFELAIDRVVDIGRGGKGAIVLAATGNNGGQIDYPARLPKVIAVGASSMCNERASGFSCNPYGFQSQYGPTLDISAPGEFIMTTAVTNTGNYPALSNYSYSGGTSLATPIAGAIAALIIGVQPCFFGTEVREILEGTAEPKGKYAYIPSNKYPNFPNLQWHQEMGFGIVNAEKAVQEAYARGSRPCSPLSDWWGCAPIGSRIAQQPKTVNQKNNTTIINCFPNPFNHTVTFQYQLVTNANVSLKLYDALGRYIATVVEKENQKKGKHETTYNGEKLLDGIYFYTITIDNKQQTYKFVKTN